MINIAIIPARGGSKRIPGKNIKDFFGKPIIAYSIETAIQSGLFDEVMVSTDDTEIAEVAKKYGAKVPFLRSKKNSDDYATTADVIEEVLNNYKNINLNFDFFCCLYPTSPLIRLNKIIQGYQNLINEDLDSVFPLIAYSAHIQRAFIRENSLIRMLRRENYNEGSQDSTETYYDAGQFYWMRTDKFLEKKKLFTDNSGYLILNEFEAQDINTDFDWELTKFKYQFQLEKEQIDFSKNTKKLILGTVQFGLQYGVNNNNAKPSTENVKNILDYAFENGITILDTAEAYGDSQTIIGKYHNSSKNKFEVITKFSPSRKDLSETLTIRITQNLKELGIDSLYSYMFHSFQDFKLYFDIYKSEINKLKKSGIIKKTGVSIYTNDEIEELLKYEGIDLIQLPFNLLDNTNQRSAVIKKAKDKGIEIHTRSAFLQGLFFKNSKKLPGKLMALKPYLNVINRISENNNLKLNDLSLNYVMQQENIDNVLIGVDSVDQLKENILSLQKEIPQEVITQIDLIDVKETALLNPSNWK